MVKKVKIVENKPKYVKIKKNIVKIYLKNCKFCKYKSIPLDEEDIDLFYEELNDDKKVMEFGDFYFLKDNLNYIKLKEVIIKEKQD